MLIYQHMKKLDNIIKQSKRLTFKFTKYQEEERLFIEETINKYLESVGMSHISNQLCYCLHEQASNACKANSKRVYFIEKNLDITNSDDYKKGISNFKEHIIKNKNHYFLLREKNNLYIKFQIKRDHEKIYISIINNVPLTKEEKEIIDKKIEMTSKYDNMMDALDDLHDMQEGAGLGIFSTIMILKELGIEKNNLNLFSNDKETHSTTIIYYA